MASVYSFRYALVFDNNLFRFFCWNKVENIDNREYLLSCELVILGKDLTSVHSTELGNSTVLLFLAKMSLISVMILPKSELN